MTMINEFGRSREGVTLRVSCMESGVKKKEGIQESGVRSQKKCSKINTFYSEFHRGKRKPIGVYHHFHLYCFIHNSDSWLLTPGS
jgi:hypothetical protein